MSQTFVIPFKFVWTASGKSSMCVFTHIRRAIAQAPDKMTWRPKSFCHYCCFSVALLQSEGTRISHRDIYQNDSREHGHHSTICCTNQIIMSLLFAHLWSGARPQLWLPVDPTETHTGRTGKEVSLSLEESEEKIGIMCEVRLKGQGNDQVPEPADRSDLDKEGERRSSSSEAQLWSTWS